MNLRKATIRIVLAFVSIIAIGGMIASCSSDEFEGPKKTLARRKIQSGEPEWNIEKLKARDPDSEYGHFLFGDENVLLEVQLNWTEGYLDRSPWARVSFSKPVEIFSKRYDKRNTRPAEGVRVLSSNAQILSSGTYVRWSTSGFSLHNVDVQVHYRLIGTLQHSNGDSTCWISSDTIDTTITEKYTIPDECFE